MDTPSRTLCGVHVPSIAAVLNPVATAAREGLAANPKTLPPWLFYDERGSLLFERITALPEYYLSRTERALFAAHASDILLAMGTPVTVAELGAGSASKTGVLLAAAAQLQDTVLYQPIDVSPSALEIAAGNLERDLPQVRVRTQVANYVTEPYRIERPAGTKILALYIGSSIGNFTPQEARGILAGLRRQLAPGDALLLGTDLAPGPHKPVKRLLAAYDDAAGVTAAFNRNILLHLNEKLHANFDPECFAHDARWNETESRIEMHLRSLADQTVMLPADSASPAITIHFRAGEAIHTENSYKFTRAGLSVLLDETGFSVGRTFQDGAELFAVTLAVAV